MRKLKISMVHPATSPLQSSSSKQSAILAANAQAAELLLRNVNWQDAIDTVLRIIGEVTQVDRVYIYQDVEYFDQDVIAELAAEWTSENVKPSGVTRFSVRDTGFFDWRKAYVRKTPIVTTTKQLDAIKRTAFDAAGIKSVASVPIFVRDAMWGVIGLSDYVFERHWKKGEVESLVLLATMLGAAIERQQLQEDMAKSARLENFGHLSASISHDFKNILAGISLQTHLLERSKDLDEASKTRISRIKLASEKGKQLTEQLLSLATGKNSQFYGPVDMHLLLEENLRLLQPPPTSKLKLVGQMSASNAVIVGSRPQLQQIIMNLIINAIEAMENVGSLISVRTKNIVTQHDEDALMVEFEDNGPGMDEHTRNRIFNPFFTTKLNGYGLGLSATRGFVLEHNGNITVASRPGQGTTFRLVFNTIST